MLICFSISPLSMTPPHLFLHVSYNLGQSYWIWSSISFKGNIKLHLRLHSTILKGQRSFLCWSKSFLIILPQISLLGQITGVNLQSLRCLSISPFLIMSSHEGLMQLTESSWTNLLIGIFGFSCPIILRLQRGQVGVFLMHSSQKRLWQQGVSTASSKISRQMGHNQRSSDKLDAEK